MSIPPSLDARSQKSPSKLSPPTEGDITVKLDDPIPASLNPSQSSATTGGGGSVVERPRSYTREELAVGRAAMSAAYYSQATKASKLPRFRYDDWSAAKWEQSVATNRSAALRYLKPARDIDPSLASVVDVMVTGYQVPKEDAWKALNELSAM